MFYVYLFLAVIGALVAAGCSLQATSGARRSRGGRMRSALSLPVAVALAACSSSLELEAASPTSADGGDAQSFFVSDEFVRRILVRPDEPRRVYVTTRERSPFTGEWNQEVKSLSTTYVVSMVSTRSSDEMYVLGRLRGEIDVVEKWVYEAPIGAYAASRPTSPEGCAAHAAETSSNLVVVGGTFLPFAQRDQPGITRTELYRGSDFDFRYLCIDPDGRFLFLLGGDEAPGIYRLDVHEEDPPAPELAVSVETLPELIDASGLTGTLDSVHTRAWWVDYDNADDVYSVLLDTDNDCDIDHIVTDTYAGIYSRFNETLRFSYLDRWP